MCSPLVINIQNTWKLFYLKNCKFQYGVKKIQEFSVDELDSLAANINPGIEYEYAIYYSLLDYDSQQYFRAHVLDNHPDK